jgi:(p)ppGpp synthase/HD superfamily hydrolase
MTDATVLTDRFDRALLYATHVRGGQVRKGASIPYIAHLLAVAATVLEYDGCEDMAIAALLHDAVEDQGGEPRLADIRNRFGDRVADIVRACSDQDTCSWRQPTSLAEASLWVQLLRWYALRRSCAQRA